MYNPRDFWHFITYFHTIVHNLKTKQVFFTKYKIKFVVPVATKYKISPVSTRFMSVFAQIRVKMHWKKAFYILISCITPRFLTPLGHIWGVSERIGGRSRVLKLMCFWGWLGVFKCSKMFVWIQNRKKRDRYHSLPKSAISPYLPHFPLNYVISYKQIRTKMTIRIKESWHSWKKRPVFIYNKSSFVDSSLMKGGCTAIYGNKMFPYLIGRDGV